MVDFPDAERPVNHIVRPGWPRSEERSTWVREWGCQVMLLGTALVGIMGWNGKGGKVYLRRHCYNRPLRFSRMYLASPYGWLLYLRYIETWGTFCISGLAASLGTTMASFG